MRIKLFLLLIGITLFFSCDILRFNFESFSFDYFKVSSWSPGEGYFAEPENITVSLHFSLDPNRASVEKNFSLTANGNRVRGTFFWNDKNMLFKPLTPLELNTDYTISLSNEACNTKGLSLDEAFIRDFTTRSGNERPMLLSCYPDIYDEIDDPRAEIRLSFSIPVPLTALYSSISFNPSMSGSWRLENDNEGTNSNFAVFTPAEPWQKRTRYEVKISTSLADNNGMNIGNEFLSIFTIGTDSESPYLVSAQRITKNNDYIDLYQTLDNEAVFNEKWEKEDRLVLTFSEPVDFLTVKNNLDTENASSFILETSPLETNDGFCREFIFNLETIPVYESIFTIILKPGVKDNNGNESKNEYIYKIIANGQFSKPPKLIGFRMPMAPAETPDDNDLLLFSADTETLFKFIPIEVDYYPSGESVATWIELYFDSAGEIDPFSVMDLFRVDSSNLVFSFSPRRVKTTNFSVPEPQSGWVNYKRIEIAGILTNSTNNGLIYLQIGSGLLDSLGNKNENPQRISVIK